jgi:hypothetical protein
VASWDTPVVQAPSTASYAAPLVNFDDIRNAPKTYYAGQQMARDQEKATLFRNGIPKDANGNIDVSAMTDKMARAGGAEYAMPLINMQMQSQMGQQAASAIVGPQGQPAPAQAVPGAPSAPPTSIAAKPLAPPSANAPQGDQHGSIISMIPDGVSPDATGRIASDVANAFHLDPNETPPAALVPRIKAMIANRTGVPIAGPAAVPAGASPVPQQAASAPPQGAGTVSAADRLDGEATFIRARAAAISAVNPKAAEVLNKEADTRADKAKQLRDQAADAPSIKEWHQSGSNLSYDRWVAQTEGDKEAARQKSQVAPSIREWRQSGSTLPYDQWVATTEGNKEKAKQDATTAPSIREWQQSGSKLSYDDWVEETEASKAGARETAKAAHRFKEVQPIPGGPTYLVPESKLVGDQADGSQPGMVAKQPAFIADRQKEIAKDEQSMLEQYRGRQIARERLQTLADLMQTYETGSFAQRKAEFAASLRGAGIPVRDTDTANPAAFQTFLKNATANVFDNAKALGGRILVSEINGLTKANANPEMQPEANRAILGQAIGLLDHQDKHFNDYFSWKRQNPNAYDPTEFETKWTQENPVKTFTTKAERSIAAKGIPVPSDPAKRVVNQRYVTPKGPAIWMGNGWKLDGPSAPQ